VSATCRSCNAEILWCITPAGRRMPLNAKAVTFFVFVGAKDAQGNPIAETRQGYVSHFADCPNAAAHRKAP